MKAPCFKCPERHIGCHSDCTRGYKEFKEYRQRISNARQKALYINDYFTDAVNKSVKLRRQHA